MSASIVPLPGAAAEPVKQHKRRGPFPPGVVNARGRLAERRRQATFQQAAQCVAEEEHDSDGIALSRMFGELAGLYHYLPAQLQGSLLHRVRELLAEVRP